MRGISLLNYILMMPAILIMGSLTAAVMTWLAYLWAPISIVLLLLQRRKK